MSIETEEDLDLLLKFAKYAIIGQRMAHPEASAKTVADLAFDDATAMVEEFQARVF